MEGGLYVSAMVGVVMVVIVGAMFMFKNSNQVRARYRDQSNAGPWTLVTKSLLIPLTPNVNININITQSSLLVIKDFSNTLLPKTIRAQHRAISILYI